MRVLAIIILVAASVVSVYLTARKNKLRREEEARREEERKKAYYDKITAPKVRANKSSDAAETPNNGSKTESPINPFEEIEEPFEGVAVPEEGCLSPAQYYEWLCDFRAAEKAGIVRPTKTGKPISPFAVKLAKTNELSYLYKLSGFTPQNSLPRMPVEEKVKPQNPTCLFKNKMPSSFPLDSKFTAPTKSVKFSAVSFPIQPKDTNVHDIFVSFYIGKN